MNENDQRVAVIAIHGVGQHLSGASADAVSSLLLSLGREGREGASAPYSGFDIKSVDVPLRMVQSHPYEASIASERAKRSKRWWTQIWSIFDERRGYLSYLRQDKPLPPSPLGYEKRELRPNEPDRGDNGYQFMLTQLAEYDGEVDRNFQTVRLEGKRQGSPAASVHVYDSHYSDLTKPESSILAFFFSFYQLLFHLCSLSLMAVYWTEAENVEAEKQIERENRAEAERSEVQSKEKVRRYKPRIFRWRLLSSIHATSVRLLTMAIPTLNVVLLEIAASAFIDKTYCQGWLPAVACSFAAILSLGATFLLLRQKGSPSRPFLWALIPLFGTALGAAILSGIACLCQHALSLGISFYQTLLLLSWLLTAGLILGLVAKRFDQLRPGAFALSLLLFIINSLGFLIYLIPHAQKLHVPAENQLATASLWAVQWIFGELVVAWVVCLVCAFLSWLPLGWLCKHAIKNDEPRLARTTAAFRTGRFAFAVPAILFVIVTTVLWSGVLVYGSYKLKAFDGVSCDVEQWEDSSLRLPQILVPKVNPVQLWISGVKDGKWADECKSDGTAQGTIRSTIPSPGYWTNYLKGLLLVSVTPGLPITMAIFAVVLFLLIWAVLPSVIFEIKPEWTRNAPANRIRWLGEWLSRGLDNIAILTRLLWLAIVPLPLIFFALDWYTVLYAIPHHISSPLDTWLLNPASKYTLQLIERTGLYLAVSAAAVSTFILKSTTSVLDTILDVDNYLRTSPVNQTPRARIAERCTSLLRYIANYRDAEDRPYTKLIIVAHSLGSMVTTDLLRYLERSGKASPDPDLAPYGFRRKHARDNAPALPIYVFSMGSPLRQLLNRFFPHLYWWVSDIPDNSLHALSNAIGPPMPAITSDLPRSDEMNATLWVNAYRSGDYIGRNLWVGQWFNRNESNDATKPPDQQNAGYPRSCREMCVGLGAHTHYWDRSAADIAVELDRLIGL